jgi:polar amino acid transport system substrate-binding protein
MATVQTFAGNAMKSNCMLVGLWGLVGALAQAHGAAQSVVSGIVVSVCYDDTAVRPWLTPSGKPLFAALEAKSGVKLNFVPLPWRRCLRDVSSGTMGGAVGASYSEERARFAVYPATSNGQLDMTRCLEVSSYSLYRIKGAKVEWNGKAFSYLTTPVLVQGGYSVAADLARLYVEVDQSAGSPETVFKMLIAGRADLGAMVTEDGDKLLALPAYSAKLEKIKVPFVSKPYFFIFGKRFYSDNKALVDRVWEGLAVLRNGP